MPLKALLFDLWETLMQDPPERGRPRQQWRVERIDEVFRRFDVSLPHETILEALQASTRTLTAMHDNGRDLDARGRIAHVLSHFDEAPELPGEALDGLELAITTMPTGLEPILRPDSLATLAAAKAHGLRTALVSNAGLTTAPNLRMLLDGFGLTRHLDVFVFSDDLQIAKPDPRIFEKALLELGCAPGEAAFVGDSPHNDIAGAQKAGMLAAQIGDRTQDGIMPDILLEELADLIPSLQGRGLLPDSVPQR